MLFFVISCSSYKKNVVQSKCENIKFVQLSDLHVGKEKAENEKRLKKVVDHLNKKVKPDFVIITGDLVQGDLFQKSKDTYITVKNILDKLHFPYYVLEGNHDNKKLLAETFNIPFDNNEKELIYPLISKKEVDFILLGTLNEAQRNTGKLTPDKIFQLKKQLDQRKDKEVFLLFHHPPVEKNDLKNIEELLDKKLYKNIEGMLDERSYKNILDFKNKDLLINLLKKHPNVTHVSSGHLHLGRSYVKNNITFTLAPSISCPEGPLHDSFAKMKNSPIYVRKEPSFILFKKEACKPFSFEFKSVPFAQGF